MAGALSIVLTILTAQLQQATGWEFGWSLVGFFGFSAFVFIVYLGIGPWAATFGLKYPMHNTQGYREDLSAEPEKERGGYGSQGWRRKRERQSMRFIKALGLYIEPDMKS
ncbi:hypothetical protein ACFOEZ_19725 [Tianweitania populi]|uniref:Uncharacterized protein n=1 Tax=Tianweitania populi TaxID=1607949 RepID=A0A8J3GKD3_9HYPH|nr:hypothetical protein [Tianweitania populi]GHD13231.1 hypothetical protein GCM10016234_18530 [Tianweitania populi]